MIFLGVLKRSTSNLHHYCSKRHLNYVNKVRYLQRLKENPIECQENIPNGKFLLFKGSRPLMHSQLFEEKSVDRKGIVWLSYNEVKMITPHATDNCVLLDVTEKEVITYALHLRSGDTLMEKLIDDNDGQFIDLRIAILLSSWKEGQSLSRANSLIRWNILNEFCGKCGSETSRNTAGNQRICKKEDCKQTFYPTLNPVGIVLITDPDKEHTLLVRQPRSVKGMYSCVAGFADVGESLEETVHREVAEEVGIELLEVQYAASQHWPFPSSLMNGCYAIAHKQKLSLDHKELADGKWFTRQEISDAIDRINEDPINRLTGNSSNELIIPPPGAIAYHLLYHWLHRTPIQDIGKHIYQLL